MDRRRRRAFGAAYLIGPKIFERLGARVVAINARTTAAASTSTAARRTCARCATA
jgi:hypothetical protein